MRQPLFCFAEAEASLEPSGFNLRSAPVGAKQAPLAPSAPSSASGLFVLPKLRRRLNDIFGSIITMKFLI